MDKLIHVDVFYNLFTHWFNGEKIAIISYRYKDEFGLHDITTRVPCKMIEFQSVYHECLIDEHILISPDKIDIGTKTPFPMVVRISRN